MSRHGMQRDRTQGKSYRLESRAFYLGAHGIDPKPVMEEIEAKRLIEFAEEREELRVQLRELEGKKEQVKRVRPEAEAVWTRIKKELGDVPPPFFHTALMLIFASFALSIDTLFLAPSMDILNVVNPAVQFLAAAGVAILCTAWFEFSGITYLRAGKNFAQRVVAVVAAGIGASCLIAWGLLRGYQLKFAAGLEGNPLGSFLGEHPILASIFFIFVTLGTPIIGAVALLNAWNELSQAVLWRKVKRRFEELRTAEIKTAREAQSAAEALEHFDQEKDAFCREWKAIFNQFYARGRENGARKETLASVVRKSFAGGLTAAFPAGLLAFALPAAFVPALVAAPIAVGVGLFTYLNHRRHHPDHDRYLEQENTRFAVIPDAPRTKEIQPPAPRLLPKGDYE
jgi:hypothetical protein